MQPKEIKIAFKEIREAIKNEDYDMAIKKCNNILNAEPNNYMALVLMGASYQHKDKKISAKYLRRALESAGENPPTIALQGLVNCAEIHELPDILQELLKLIPEKYIEYHTKILTISTVDTNLDNCIQILESETQIENNEVNKHRIQSAYIKLAKIFIKITEVPEKYQYLLKPAFKLALDDSSCSPHLEYFKRLLKQLYKLNEIEEVLKTACQMINLYANEVYPLEWICKIYIDCYAYDQLNFTESLDQPISNYVQKLLELYPNSQSGNYVKAILLYTNQDYVQARDVLLGVQSNSTVVAVQLLAKCCIEIGAYKMAEDFYRSIEMGHNNHDLYMKCLSYSKNKETLTEALELLNKCDKNNVQILENLARIYFNLKDEDNLKQIISKIKNLNNLDLATILEAEYLTTAEDAIVLLEKLSDNNFTTELLKGKLYLKLQQHEKSLTCLLKATKLKPYKYECFLYLGLLYATINDITRSAKCLDKCLYLNPYCEKALTNLCEINRRNEDFDSDLTTAIINRILKYVPSKQSHWILFQQGLHFMHLKKFDNAINSFRTVLRYDIKNVCYWEALADSYQERGSYDSAMRVYEKIIEIDPTNLYSKLQVGTLQTILRMYETAIESFDKILEQDPNFVPALKGAADAHFGLANTLLPKQLLGRAKNHFQLAINYLQRIYMYGKQNMVWIWRFTGKIFVSVGRMPESLAFLEISGKLVGKNDPIVKLNQNDLFQLAIKYFTCAIKLNEEDTLLWNDLALCAYHYAIMPNQTAAEQEKNIELARKACKLSIKCQSKRWKTWNLLGVLYTIKSETIKPNYSLAQHYFIKSLKLEKKSAITWSNLGVIYLQAENILLANKAFNRALQSDPEYTNGWIGSALIAEKVGENVEAMDMFRNCTELTFHEAAALGYADWVCSVVSDSERMAQQVYKYAIENMYAIPVAHDCITWYLSTAENMASVAALSYYGYLSARQNQWLLAIRAFIKASEKASGKEKDMMLLNLGYCLIKNNEPVKAIKAFSSISEATLKSTIGLALSYSQNKQYEESYTQYTSALDWMTATDLEKADILLAMSAMIYPFQGDNDTKAVLYQCMSLTDRPIEALFSACALGIKHDIQLAETVVEELKKYENDLKYCHDVAFLTAQYYLKNKKPKIALIHLISKVHQYPNNSKLRTVLVNFIANNYSKTTKYSHGACQIAQSVIILGHQNIVQMNSLESAKSLLTASEVIKNVNVVKQRQLIQQAIHLHPANKLAWQALLTCQVK